jgi:LEA14-like dessication related protein
MGRKTVVLLLVILLAVTAGVIWWKRSGKEMAKQEVKQLAPEIRIASMNITDIDDDEIKLTSETVVDNNLPADLTIDSLDYTVSIDSIEVVKSTYPKEVVIKKSDSATLKLPLRIKTAKLKTLLHRFEKQNRDSADYTINAHFKLRLPVAGKRAFDLAFTKRLPAIREIKVKPADIDIEKFGFRESEMKMDVQVTNRNVFPIKIKNGTYTVAVEKDLEAEGAMEPIVVVPAKGSETVTVTMKLKTAKVPKLGWKLLFRKKETNFNMSFSGLIMSDNDIFNNSKIKMKANGTIEELKQLAK